MPASAVTAIILVAAYLLGSLSGSLMFGRLRGVDIRTQGSGNAGGTNALRTQGWKFAIAVVAFDLLKGGVAAWLALRYAPREAALSVTAHGYAAAFAAILGHVWPIWHGFRGGKGAATLAGAVLVLWPWIAPLVFLAWAIAIVVGGYVGLATVLAGLSLAALALVFDGAPSRLWFCLAAAALMVVMHRGNLLRLLRGEESRFERARLLSRIWRRA